MNTMATWRVRIDIDLGTPLTDDLEAALNHHLASTATQRSYRRGQPIDGRCSIHLTAAAPALHTAQERARRIVLAALADAALADATLIGMDTATEEDFAAAVDFGPDVVSAADMLGIIPGITTKVGILKVAARPDFPPPRTLPGVKIWPGPAVREWARHNPERPKGRPRKSQPTETHDPME